MYRMTPSLRSLFDAFIGGLAWLEELSGKLLLLLSEIVRVCHFQDVFWEELGVFLEYLFSAVHSSSEIDRVNDFLQVCQEVCLYEKCISLGMGRKE